MLVFIPAQRKIQQTFYTIMERYEVCLNFVILKFLVLFIWFIILEIHTISFLFFYHPSHVYRSSPMSSHFVRSMILMRKGWVLQRCNQAWNKIVVLNCWWKGWNRISSSWWTVQWITWTFLFCMQWNIKFTHMYCINIEYYNDFFCKVWRNIFLNI